MRVGTIRQSTVTDFAIGGAICPKCKQPFTAQMNRTIQTATMLAVPFMKKTGERYTICPHCGLRYSFTPDMYSSLRQRPTADFLYQICSGMLLKGQEKAEKHSARSRKNAGLAAVLALLLGVFGAQNWYLGHYKRALIACILDALGLVCFFAALAVENAQPLLFLAAGLFAFSLYWGLVDTVRILLGRAKDAEGLYVCTRRQHARWMEKKEKLSPRALLGAVREAAAYKPFRSFFILILFFYLSWHLDWTMWYLGEVQYMKMTEAHLSIFNAACCVVQLFAIGFFARLNNRKSVDFTMPLAVGSMCVSCLAIITGAMVPEGIRPWWFIVVATLATIPQSSLQLCIVQMLLDAVPPKNRSLIISIYTMVITLSNSVLPLLGVELYQALGGDMRALVLFYSIAFVWRALSAGLFWMRYRRRRKEENAGSSGEKEGETAEKSSV